MKVVIAILSLTLITACSHKTQQHKKVNVDPEMLSYFHQVEKETGKTIDDVEITLERSPTRDVASSCHKVKVTKNEGLTEHIYKTPKIIINSNYWNDPSTTEQDRAQLIRSEIDYCKN